MKDRFEQLDNDRDRSLHIRQSTHIRDYQPAEAPQLQEDEDKVAVAAEEQDERVEEVLEEGDDDEFDIEPPEASREELEISVAEEEEEDKEVQVVVEEEVEEEKEEEVEEEMQMVVDRLRLEIDTCPTLSTSMGSYEDDEEDEEELEGVFLVEDALSADQEDGVVEEEEDVLEEDQKGVLVMGGQEDVSSAVETIVEEVSIPGRPSDAQENHVGDGDCDDNADGDEVDDGVEMHLLSPPVSDVVKSVVDGDLARLDHDVEAMMCDIESMDGDDVVVDDHHQIGKCCDIIIEEDEEVMSLDYHGDDGDEATARMTSELTSLTRGGGVDEFDWIEQVEYMPQDRGQGLGLGQRQGQGQEADYSSHALTTTTTSTSTRTAFVPVSVPPCSSVEISLLEDDVDDVDEVEANDDFVCGQLPHHLVKPHAEGVAGVVATGVYGEITQERVEEGVEEGMDESLADHPMSDTSLHSPYHDDHTNHRRLWTNPENEEVAEDENEDEKTVAWGSPVGRKLFKLSSHNDDHVLVQLAPAIDPHTLITDPKNDISDFSAAALEYEQHHGGGCGNGNGYQNGEDVVELELPRAGGCGTMDCRRKRRVSGPLFDNDEDDKEVEEVNDEEERVVVEVEEEKEVVLCIPSTKKDSMKGDGNDQESTPQTEGDNSMPDASIVDAITNALLAKLLHDTQSSSSSSPSRHLSTSPPITHAFQAIRHASFMPSSSLSSGQSPTKPSPSQQSPSHPSPSNHSPSNQSPSKHSPSHHGSPTSPKYIDISLPSPSQIARAQGQGLGLTQGPGLGSGPRLDSSPELRCASYSSSEKSLSPSNMSEDGRLSPAAVCSGVTLKNVSNDGLSSGTSTASRGGSSSLSLSSLSNLPPLLSTQGIKDKTTVMGHHHDMGKMFDIDDDDDNEEDLYSFMPSTTQSSSSSSSLRKGLSSTHTTTKSLHTSSTTFSPIKDDNHTNTTNNSNSTLSNPPIPPSSPSPSKLLQFLEKNPSSPVPPVSVWVRPPIVDYSDHITHFVGHIFRSGGSGTISYTNNIVVQPNFFQSISAIIKCHMSHMT